MVPFGVVTSVAAGSVPVGDPAASHADDSPPYDSSVLPTTVEPVGAVNGTT